MTESRSQYKRRPSVIRYIPRNAKKIGIVGANSNQVDVAFKSLNPSCTIQKWQAVKQFEEQLQADSNKITEPFDCVVLQKIEFDEKNLQKLLGKTQAILGEKSVLVIELRNPFFFKELDFGSYSFEAFEFRQLENFSQTVNDFFKAISRSFQSQRFLVDQVLRSGGQKDAFDTWQKKKNLHRLDNNKIWGNLKPVLQSTSIIYRVTKRTVRKIRFQSQILKPVGGVNDVRIHEPLQALASLPGVSVSASRAEKIRPISKNENRVFIWHRPVLTFESNLKHIQSLRKAGYLIVTEFDDHYSPWPKIEENKFLSFAGVHAVQTTAPKLAELLREFNPEVAVFPNQLDYFSIRTLKRDGGPVRIFFGALNREKDWRPIIRGLNGILKQTDVDFVFDVVFDKSFFDALDTENKTFTPQCTYEIYKSKLGDADISLMPLLATGFNEMKSDLKLVEAAGHGAVPIASNVVYGEEGRHREFSMICQQPEEYASALQLLLENPERRLAMQKAGREYVKNSRLLCHHLKGRYEWYQSLIEKRESLDAALEQRLISIQS